MPEPRHIGNGITSVIAELGLGQKLNELALLESWPSIVGERIATVTFPERMHDGKLVVNVTNPVWRNELQFLKADLLKKINAAGFSVVVEDIVFR